MPVPEGGVWIDLGGGTGANLEHLKDRLHRLAKVYIVDLSPSLLAVAQARIAKHGWENVEAVKADATTFVPPGSHVDVVTFSYSLTMIPNWYAALEQARRLLRPGGVIGVVDFYVSRKHPAPQGRRHGWPTRTFWPIWFALDNVFLSPDHLACLQYHFRELRLQETRSRLPYLPLVRAPSYLFIGQRRVEPVPADDGDGAPRMAVLGHAHQLASPVALACTTAGGAQ